MSFEIALVVGILSIIFLFAFLSWKLDENHAAIKLLFMLLSLLFVAVGLAMLHAIALDNYSESITNIMAITYAGYLYLFIFLVFYFIVIFILNVISTLGAKKRADEISPL